MRVTTQIVGAYTRKGGCGKSTGSFALACYATERGLRVLLVAMDPQGDSARWAGGGDRPLIPGDLFESSRGFKAIFSPREMPEVPDGEFDLIVVDMPPEVETVPLVKATLWLTFLDGRDAVIDTLPAIPTMLEASAPILFVRNKAEVAGKRVLRILQEGLTKIAVHHDQVLLSDFELPLHGAIGRVPSYSSPPWEVPFGNGTLGAVAVRNLCEEVLGLLPAVEAA